MQVTQKIKIFLDDAQRTPQPIDAVQGDAYTRKLEFSLYSGGEKWPVPDGVSVAVGYSGAAGRGLYDTLPDGSKAYTTADNVVTITLIPQVVAMHGRTIVTIVFTDSTGKQLATFGIELRVAPNPAIGAGEPADYYNLREWASTTLKMNIDREDDGSWSTDKDYDTILQEHRAGREIGCNLEMSDETRLYVPFARWDGETFAFSTVYDGKEWRVEISKGDDGETSVQVVSDAYDLQPLCVTITGNQVDGYTADVSFKDILAAHEQGREVRCFVGSATLYSHMINNGKAVFQTVSGADHRRVTIFPDSTVGNELFVYALDGDVVKTVNGVAPDENGNIEIQVSGGNVDLVEPAYDDVPKIYIRGTPPTTKDDGDVKVVIRYKSKTMDFEYPSTLKVQGNTSAIYAKKNFTWKIYSDDTYESKKKVSFRGWGGLNKFVLKAHWIDHSHIRNVGTAKLAGQVVRSRSDFDSLPEELRTAPNYGATDGFSCKVFVNGIYWGLYELIIPKDKLFGQDDDNPNHSILNSEYNDRAVCAFATTSASLSSGWSEELQDGIQSAAANSFSNLIKFVAGATDDDFVANAETYFDVQSVIDFDIVARIFMPVDNLARNQIFFTYDSVKWYEGYWDLDGVLGLSPGGILGSYTFDTPFQEGYISYTQGGLINLLYKRTEELFLERFKARYWELRKDALSEASIIDTYERLADNIVNLLAEDYAETTANGAFTGVPQKNSNNIQQIRNFVAKRLTYMDGVISAMVKPVPCTGITLSANTLTFDAKDAQTLTATIEPSDTTDMVMWESNNTNVATVADGVVTPVSNGSCTITARCGTMTAECAVTVEYAEIPCTGIILSAETLTFTGEEAQTLTATVTPDGCTDTVVWESDSPSVATVADGVVSSVANGTAIITAKCGNYSATCEVVVSGIQPNILNGINWNKGCYLATGAIKTASSGDRYTDLFSVSGLSNIVVEGIFTAGEPTGNTARIVFYTAAEASTDTLAGYAQNTSDSLAVIEAAVPDGALYAGISFPIGGSKNTLGFAGVTVRETADGEIIGELPFSL